MAEKPKLTRAERKQIEAVIRKYRGDGKPHTAQDTIPYQIMYPDGICYLGNRCYSQSMLTLIPVSLAQANEFVRQHHRHHKPVTGHKFSIGCAENGRLCAVAIVGRPVSRYLDDGFTLEVNRLCSDGTKNACSILYAAAARAARAMGYRKIITYTLDTESGASLRAAGWTNAGLAGGKAWTGSRRPAQPLYPAQMKYRYEKRLNGG